MAIIAFGMDYEGLAAYNVLNQFGRIGGFNHQRKPKT
jgi:hypothetical protein